MEHYPRIYFPYDKPFREHTKKEIDETFKWFLKIISERVAFLEKEIQKSRPDWKADFSRISLYGMGEWVKTHIECMKYAEEEKARIIKENNLVGLQADLVEELQIKLTPGSIRVRFDTAIYLGETMRKNVENLEWDIERNKRLWSYNEPILILTQDRPKNYLPMNVLKIANASTAGLVFNNANTDRFVRNFDYWKKRFTVGNTPLKRFEKE